MALQQYDRILIFAANKSCLIECNRTRKICLNGLRTKRYVTSLATTASQFQSLVLPIVRDMAATPTHHHFKSQRGLLFTHTFVTLPAQPQGLVSYSFPYTWLKIFFFLATRPFHILPYIRFRPNLVKVTGTWTTTHAQTMMGSEVRMGSLGSKRSFSPKRHQVLQNT